MNSGDDMILNIQIPTQTRNVSNQKTKNVEEKARRYNRMEKNEDRRGKMKSESRYSKDHSGFEGARNQSSSLLPNSKKIKKIPKEKKNRVTRQYDENTNAEQVLNVGEKKNEESHIFEGKSFEDITGLNPKLLASLNENNFINLTKIQKEAIPTVIKSKDCIIKSETGSGKTLAYLVPVVHQIAQNNQKIQREDGSYCIIICPTRELCVQVVETSKVVLKNLINIVVGAIMGGESIKKEKARLRKGINILVCTPGRLVYHLQNTASFNYKLLKHIVFEESDRTLDMGFKKDLDEIFNILSQRTDYNNIQKILISANFSEKIEGLTLKLLGNDFSQIGFRSSSAMEEEKNGEERTQNHDEIYITPTKLAQKYVVVGEGHRISFLLSILMASNNSKVMIFVSTCDEAEFLDVLFNNVTYHPSFGDMNQEEGESKKIVQGKTYKLHGKVDQKQRTKTYLEFKKADEGVLICTDVASRGLDFDDVKLIIQMDPPSSITDYVNRMGRTARIGNYGMSLLFLTGVELDFVGKLYDKGITVEKYDQEIYNHFIEDKIRKDFQLEYSAHAFLTSRIREFFRSDIRNKIIARKAYISYVRAYARIEDKATFHPKKLNLQLLAKSFGLSTSQSVKSEMDSEGLIPRAALKEKQQRRRVIPSKTLEKEEFL